MFGQGWRVSFYTLTSGGAWHMHKLSHTPVTRWLPPLPAAGMCHHVSFCQVIIANRIATCDSDLPFWLETLKRKNISHSLKNLVLVIINYFLLTCFSVMYGCNNGWQHFAVVKWKLCAQSIFCLSLCVMLWACFSDFTNSISKKIYLIKFPNFHQTFIFFFVVTRKSKVFDIIYKKEILLSGCFTAVLY